MIDQEELHRKSKSDRVEDRKKAAIELGNNFAYLPDKNQGWNDLYRLSTDSSGSVWIEAAYKLGQCFSYVPDKLQAWEDLHRRSIERYSIFQSSAANAIGKAFSHVPDKKEAWLDLQRLSTENNNVVRGQAASAIGRAFSHVPDKNQAWMILHKLTKDDDNFVRSGSAQALGMAFSDIPDKSQAWLDLHRLLTEDDNFVRMDAISALGQAFFQIPDKKKAWEVLFGLSTDNDRNLRFVTAFAISQAYSRVPDKKQAWKALHRLAKDDDHFVRGAAASALGIIFSQMPNKNRAYMDLYRLSLDSYQNVRAYAYHSLGKASIYKATEARNENDFRNYLEKAVGFFGISAKEATDYNPSEFCLPFYRSFYAVTFKNGYVEAEVQKYMNEAKLASKGSLSKVRLMEAIENLSNALRDAQNISEVDLDTKKHHLNACRLYCDRAAELLAETRDLAPDATKLIEKGIPIIDREILAEIQEKTKAICKQTLYTPAKEFGKEISRQGNALGQVRDPIQLEKALQILDRTLSSQVKDLEVIGLIEQARSEPYLEDRITIYNIIFGLILGKLQGTRAELAETINIQNFNVTAEKDEQPWYKDRKFLIGVLIATLSLLITKGIL